MTTIGQISSQTGVNIETIRYYEKEGILPNPPRTSGGHRVYNESIQNRFLFIRRSRELGFSIEETRSLLSMADGEFTCKQVHELTVSHLETVRLKIRDLKRLEKTLKGIVDECSRGNDPCCPVIETLSGKRSVN